MMVRLAYGLAAAAAMALATPADASPAAADLWIGLDGSDNGFLLNTDTGDVWMAGVCLKPLTPAVKTGTVWSSRTAEVVSVGRAMAMLDQTFELETDPARPEIRVSNPDRGGQQAFPAVMIRDCVGVQPCISAAAQPVCED